LADQLSLGGVSGSNAASSAAPSQSSTVNQPASYVEPYSIQRESQNNSHDPSTQFSLMAQANGLGIATGFSSHSAEGSGSGTTTSTTFSGGEEITTTVLGTPSAANVQGASAFWSAQPAR
jgi:hypothetical protein